MDTSDKITLGVVVLLTILASVSVTISMQLAYALYIAELIVLVVWLFILPKKENP